MKISVIGTGYVGLVTGACLAEVGNHVLCLDLDGRKIELLQSGGIPIHEPGLADIVHRNAAAGRLQFTTDAARAARHGGVHFIAVGTPPDENGSADLQHVVAAARRVGRHMDASCVIVDKSTVPVGTARQVRQAVAAELRERGADIPFHVVSNPEFLKEGAAVEDFMRPDRIVVGADHPDAVAVMRELYEPFERNHNKLQVMDLASAELTKYAANAMLATRISFMNELALLAESVGADIDAVRRGIGSDERIGRHFLYAGCGYGGSCFPKDIKALVRTGHEHGHPMRILEAVEAVNERQKQVLVEKIGTRFGASLAGLTLTVWGLAFKPETDDIREAPSLALIEQLLARGARVQAFDPVAMQAARAELGERAGLAYSASALDAIRGSDALIVVTEWKEFRSPDFEELAGLMRQRIIFDGRNIYSPATVRGHGFEYSGIGRP